jgi:hypothetical protein
MLQTIADNFVELVLTDHPVMIYSLDVELREYTDSIEEFRTEETKTEIYREYLKNKSNDDEINNELINSMEKTSSVARKVIDAIENNDYEALSTMADNFDEDRPDINLIAYLESIPNPIIYELMQLVLRSNKVRIRIMHELVEAELDDPFTPDKWIYHKNWKLNKVLDYISNSYDESRKEDEIEEEFDPFR